jgi:adenylate cyclase
VKPEQAERARQAGVGAVDAMRRRMARQAAALIRRDPEAAEVALEMGLVDRGWLARPGPGPVSMVGRAEVCQRFLERAVEQRPSRLLTLGLGATQLLADRLTSPPAGRVQSLTVVFTDLEGFTSYTAEHGDEAAVALLHEHHRAAEPVVRRQGGRIIKRLGDGLLCTFALPAGGIRAAVDLLATAPQPVQLRAGAHRGEAIVSGDDIIGHDVNVAARVAEIARGGHALATGDAVAAAGPLPGIRVGKPRGRRLKGIAEKVAVVEISPLPLSRQEGLAQI